LTEALSQRRQAGQAVVRRASRTTFGRRIVSGARLPAVLTFIAVNGRDQAAAASG